MIAVVVLTYDPPEGMLEDCIDAVVAAGGADVVIVVDNGNAAASRLRDRACEVVTTGRNLGYAGGVNVGLRIGLDRNADAIAVLNDDVVVEPGWLTPLVEPLGEDDRLGAVQPKLLFTGDDGRAGGVEGVAVVNSVGVEIGRDGAGRDIGHGHPDGPEFAAPRQIDAFTGGAVLFSAAFLRDVGLFDERYFLYYEDVDLALRGAEHGWTYRCAPTSRVWHRGSATTSAAGTLAARLRERNRLWILFRHRPWGDVARGVWLAARRVRHQPRGAHLWGLLAGCAGAPRQVIARRRAVADHAA